MTSSIVLSLTTIVIWYMAWTATAAVVLRDPHIGACLCTTSLNRLLTSKRACENGSVWLSENECYRYTGASAYCTSNDDYSNIELFFRLQLKSNDSVWVASKHLYLEPDPFKCIPADARPGDCPRVVTRSQWGARPPRTVVNITEPVPRIFIHHTDTPSCATQHECSKAVRGIQNFHMDTRGWDDIGYNFLVGEDGNAYEGRGWDHVGAQVRGYNSVSFGFAMIGTFDTRLPNISALSTVKQLIACAWHKGKTATNYTLHGHRDGGCTSCPGQKLYDLINTWPHYAGKLPHNCSVEEDHSSQQSASQLDFG